MAPREPGIFPGNDRAALRWAMPPTSELRFPCCGHHVDRRLLAGALQTGRRFRHNVGMKRGKVTVIFGCMFSGKTTELLRRVRTRPAAEVRCFRHARDLRYHTDEMMSHAGEHFPARRVACARMIPEHVPPTATLVAIEEVHFFDPELPDVVRQLADKGVDVLLAGLDLNSWGNPLPQADALRPLGDELVHLRATCARCGAPAERTQRLTPIIDGNLIGGPESFEPRCVNCWHPPPEPEQPMPWRGDSIISEEE